MLGISPDMVAEPTAHPITTPTPLDEDEDLKDFDGENAVAVDETDSIGYLYECAESLGSSSLSSDRQKQVRDLSYASIALHTHKDINMCVKSSRFSRLYELNTFRNRKLEEPTEEQIFQVHREESGQISSTLASISRTQFPTINTRPSPSMTLLDLSGLVDLRAAHETLQACTGVRNSNRESKTTGVSPPTEERSSEVDAQSGADFGGARQQIIKQFYQLLRDANAEGERVGTGLHRSHVWAGISGNSLNAEKAAERRMTKVCSLICLAPGEQYVYACLKGNCQAMRRTRRNQCGKAIRWGSGTLRWRCK